MAGVALSDWRSSPQGCLHVHLSAGMIGGGLQFSQVGPRQVQSSRSSAFVTTFFALFPLPPSLSSEQYLMARRKSSHVHVLVVPAFSVYDDKGVLLLSKGRAFTLDTRLTLYIYVL